MKNNIIPKVSQFVRLLTCFLLLLAVAIQRDGRYFGHDLTESEEPENAQTITQVSDGKIVVSTQEIAKDIIGYGGDIPLKITIVDGKISKIEALQNAETPAFFERVRADVIPQWIGMSVEDGLTADIDGVTGATYSSNATNETIRRALQEVANNPDLQLSTPKWFSWKWLVALLVVIAGAIVPLFYKDKRYRIVQLLLNVIVLGFWSGTFVSYTLIVNYLSNGTSILPSLVPIILLIVAFIYPLFGKQGHYCAWNCPLGSLQELAGKCRKSKWALSAKTLKYLNYFRECLWAVLMLVMCTGISFAWLDYELFTAFMFQQASWAVITVALLFVALSLFVQRPFCRFVCPMGTLFKLTQNTKQQ
jgi:uncharacterized protein with FMN-binding domain